MPEQGSLEAESVQPRPRNVKARVSLLLSVIGGGVVFILPAASALFAAFAGVLGYISYRKTRHLGERSREISVSALVISGIILAAALFTLASATAGLTGTA